MDINKVIEIIRESKKASKCPPGFKYSKEMKSCVPIKKKGKKGKYGYVRSYFGGGYHRGGDNRSGNGNGNGNGGNGNGNGSGNGNGGNGGGNGDGNGGGGNGGGGGE